MKPTIEVVCVPPETSAGEDWFAAYCDDMAAERSPFTAPTHADPRKLIAHTVPITVEQHIVIVSTDPTGAVREVADSPDVILSCLVDGELTEHQIDPDGNVTTRRFRVTETA